MMEKYKFDCFFLSFRLNSSPLNFYLRLVLQPALLPMMCHISTLNKPPHVAGANLFRNLNPHRRNILPVTARKWRQCRSCNSDQLLGTFLLSAASSRPAHLVRHQLKPYTGAQRLQPPTENFSCHVSAKCILLLLFKRLFHVRKYIVLYRNLSQVTTQSISENGMPSNGIDFYLTCS